MTLTRPFARSIALRWRHLPVARSPQFAKWFLRHRGLARTAGLSQYQFVYRYALARRGVFSLRITTPLYLSQVTHSTTSRSEQRWTRFLPAMREAPVSQSTIFRSAHNVRQVEFVRLESNRSHPRIERETAHLLLASARPDRSFPASASFLERVATFPSTFRQHLIHQTAFPHFSAQHSVLALRAKEGSLPDATTRHFPFMLPGRSRFEAHLTERVLAQFVSPAASSRLVGSKTAALQIFIPPAEPRALRARYQFFTPVATRSLSFQRGMTPFAPTSTGFTSALLTSERHQTGGESSIAHTKVSQSFAFGLPNTRAARELQLTTRMVLSTRPEQVLAAGSTTYVFAQQPRPATAEPPRSFASDHQEVVDLVQGEVKKAMSSGFIVANFSRHDFVNITDQVESLLKRRLLAEKERLGLSSN